MAPQRRELSLLPGTKPVESTTPAASEHVSGDDGGEDDGSAGTISEADASKKVDEDLKELFAIRNVDEGEEYFKLPAEHQHLLVDKLVNKAIELKEAGAQLVADLFARAVEKGLCVPDTFEQGFLPIAELLDDIVIDAPKAFNLMAIMMKGAGLATDDERRARIAGKSMDSDKLITFLE
jgi:translation initiation factor 4G